MKKIILTLLAFFLLPSMASAANVTLWSFLSQYAETQVVPSSYEYIQLRFKNLIPTTNYYRSLQKLVYLDKMPNIEIELPLGMLITEEGAYNLFKKFENIEVSHKGKINLSQQSLIIMLSQVKLNISTASHNTDSLPVQEVYVNTTRDIKVTWIQEFKILEDVYNRLVADYVDNVHLDKKELIQWAILWMTHAADDQFTSYFPPTEAVDFNETLEWEFEWIWAYVDLPSPWVFIITSPIPGSPSQKAWLQWGDQVIKVGDKIITQEDDIATIISRIKWPSWSTVVLTIRRGNREFDVTVAREHIKIEQVTTKKLNDWVQILDINMFSENVYSDFLRQLKSFDLGQTDRIILDLTYNPWGSLDQVKKILYHFVAADLPLVYVVGVNSEEVIKSAAVDPSLWLWNKEIVVMINKWSASAAEILAWDIREYVKKSVIVGEKSYGKWSVQNVIEYYDWSLLKITTAKWYTWKNKYSIDKVWIIPDIVVSDNKDTEIDEILETAKAYRF